MLFPGALLSALRGDIESARADADEGLGISLANEDFLSASCNRAVLGFLELSLSHPSKALEHLAPVLSFLRTMDAAEPGIIPCVPDAVEALVSLGKLAEAEQLIGGLEHQGTRFRRPWAIATGTRCRGLLLAARRRLPAARSALEQAVAAHGEVRQPFELGRTLLIKGEVERRAKQKRAARSSLEQAHGIFDELGATLWTQKARTELARVRTGAATPGELTPTEERIAQLVGEGRKNREIASTMFLSVKTVEANVSRIFHKLGVHSRTELTRMIAERETMRRS
jgi:DNA-binding CsgD family transcriptional regulator